MAYTWTKREAELKLIPYTDKKKQIINVDNINSRIEQIPKLKLQPYTIVNLLGKYGNFEEDSNGDGLADWWDITSELTPSLESGVINLYSQKLTFNNPSADRGIIKDLDFILPHTYFASFYAKCSNASSSVILKFTDYGIYSNSEYFINLVVASTSWEKYYGTLTTAKTQAKILLTFKDIVDGDIAWIDGLSLIDLTAMGALPSGLQAYFNNAVTNWEDLATTSNITAIDGREQTGEDWLAELIPYVDSVASLGYQWGE